MSLYSEIKQQPSSLKRLLQSQRSAVEKMAETFRANEIRFAYIAARGTSENAGRYANYLWGAKNGFPVALAAPSLFTYYNSPPLLNGALIVGISQSGRSPDIVSVLEEGKRQGCLTLAITNETESPLAQAADFVLDIDAGQENAVAATKTYSAELTAIAMLATAMSHDSSSWVDLLRIPEWVELALANEDLLRRGVEGYKTISRCVILGRGFNFATAHEWALKLNELTYVEAQPYSSADFLHGPIAMVDQGFPVLTVIPDGAICRSMMEVVLRLRNEYDANLLVISNVNEALQLGKTSVPLPAGIPEWLTPIVSIVPAQLFCYHLAVAKGCDTDSPRGIHKVTETR